MSDAEMQELKGEIQRAVSLADKLEVAMVMIQWVA